MFYGDLFSLTLPSATHMYSFDSFAYVLNERFQINSMKFRAYSFLQKYRSLRNSAFIFGMEKETKDFGFLFGFSVTNRRKRKEGRKLISFLTKPVNNWQISFGITTYYILDFIFLNPLVPDVH